MPAGAHEKLTHSEEAVLSAQVDDDSLLQEEACGLFWTLRPSTVESEKHISKRWTLPSWWFSPSPIQTIFEVDATGQTRPKRTAHVSPSSAHRLNGTYRRQRHVTSTESAQVANAAGRKLAFEISLHSRSRPCSAKGLLRGCGH